MTTKPDRSSGEPLHSQLVGLIRAEMDNGSWQVGQKLPSEHEMSSRFGVSRATVRQALAELQRQGLIETQRGHGSFVTRGHPRAWQLQSTGGFLDDHVIHPDAAVVSRVLRSDVGALPPWACGALGLAVGSEGVTIERLRWVGDDLVLYGINHLPSAFAEHVVGCGLEQESLYRRLEDRAGVHLTGSRRTIEAVTANVELAHLLGVQRGHPLTLVEIVSWDGEGRPIECHRSWVRTDRMRLEVLVGREPRVPRAG